MMSNLESTPDEGTWWSTEDDTDYIFEDRECPECEGTGYDDDDTPCEWCFGDGVL